MHVKIDDVRVGSTSIYIYIPGSEVPRTVATLFYLTGSACRLSAYVRAAERQSYNPGQNGRPCYIVPIET
jgi:hypothetical protein